MIKSRGAKGKGRVTFTIDPQAGAQTAAVCGEWNAWSADADVMQPDAEGGFSVTVDLDPGRAYRFRYLLDGQRWDDDWAADAYVRYDFGGDDSVVDLTALPEAVPPAARKAPAKKEAAKKAASAKEAVAGAVPAAARKAPAGKAPAREARAKGAAEAGAVPAAAKRTPAKKAAPGQTAEKAPLATRRAGTSAKAAASAQAARKAVPAAKRSGKTAK